MTIKAAPKFAKPYFVRWLFREALELYQIYIDHADPKDEQNIARAQKKIIELGGKANK